MPMLSKKAKRILSAGLLTLFASTYVAIGLFLFTEKAYAQWTVTNPDIIALETGRELKENMQTPIQVVLFTILLNLSVHL